MEGREKRALLEDGHGLAEGAVVISKAEDAVDEPAALVARGVRDEHPPV